MRRIIPGRFRGRTRGLDDELSFWRAYIETRGLQWPEEYEQRVDPRTALRADIASYLDGNRVLDAGAGPLTILGKTVAGRTLDLVPVDALANRYDELLEQLGVRPPVRTIQGLTEELASQFPRDSFDLAYARNTLDHSSDPIEAVRQMALVTRPGGIVFLEHADNEGARNGYGGLHQWNLLLADGHLLVSKRSRRPRDLGEELSSILETVETRKGEDRLHTVVLRRI